MAIGKYSPILPQLPGGFIYNALGQVPAPYEVGNEYDEKIHFGDYDSEGFDSYGYSAFNKNGEYVGPGSGVDRDGMSDYDYLVEASLT